MRWFQFTILDLLIITAGVGVLIVVVGLTDEITYGVVTIKTWLERDTQHSVIMSPPQWDRGP